MLPSAFTTATAAPPAKIPDLRPPENPIAPTLWQQISEQHRTAAIVTGVLLLAVAVLLVWWWRRPRRRPPVMAASVAREQLRQLAALPEDGALAGQVARVLRTYLTAAVRTLPQAELTAEEIAGRLPAAAPWLGTALIAEINVLLRECDRMKFASAPAAKGGAAFTPLPCVPGQGTGELPDSSCESKRPEGRAPGNQLAVRAEALVESVAAKGAAERLRVPPVLKNLAAPAKAVTT